MMGRRNPRVESFGAKEAGGTNHFSAIAPTTTAELGDCSLHYDYLPHQQLLNLITEGHEFIVHAWLLTKGYE